MLSFIYSLANNYEQMFGERPNLLYINRYHFDRLRENFAEPDDLVEMMRLLGMTVMISRDAVTPHVACLNHTSRPRAFAQTA